MVFESIIAPLGEVYDGNAVAGFFKTSEFHKDATYADRELYIDSDTGRSITFAEYRRVLPRIAGYLQSEFGVNKGDCVAIFMANNIHIPLIHMSTISLGAIISPANVMYSAEELAHQFRVSKPKLGIIMDQFFPVAEEAAKVSEVAVRLVKLSDIAKVLDRLFTDDSAPTVDPVLLDGKTTPAYYCFSSGTSGLPKCVVTTHFNILVNAMQCNRSSTELKGPDIGASCVLPMSHIFALNTGVWSGPYSGWKTVIFSKFDVEDFVAKVVKYKLEMLYLVPPIILLLYKLPVLQKYPEFNEVVKIVVSGAAPISKETISLFNSKCPKVRVVQGYGLTETSPITHIGFATTPYSYDENSIGWLVPGAQAQLVNYETGEVVKDYNQPGELWLKGPMVMRGYLNNDEANESAFSPDGWFKTGDVAVVNETHQYYIVDRIKELIKSNGHQVAPAELESLLLSHPHVNDAAVIGVLNRDKTSENPRAYVVLVEGSDPLQVINWFNRKVAKHKRLWGGLVVIQQIPKSASGKILRNELRKRNDADAVMGRELAAL